MQTEITIVIPYRLRLGSLYNYPRAPRGYPESSVWSAFLTEADRTYITGSGVGDTPQEAIDKAANAVYKASHDHEQNQAMIRARMANPPPPISLDDLGL